MHDVRAAPEADVDVLDADVGVDDAGDDDGGGGDGVGDFADQRRGGAEGGRGDGGAGEGVDDDGDDDVEGDAHRLEEGEGFGKVGGPAQFGDEAEVGRVAGEGDDDICQAEGVGLEGGVAAGDDEDGGVRVGLEDADADHGDDDGGGYGEAGWEKC